MTAPGHRRITDVGLLAAALLVGGVAAATLRFPWTRSPAGVWMWALLVASGVAGGAALARIGAWLPEGIPPIRPVAPEAQRPKVIGAVLLGAAGVLTAWVVWRLWPNYYAWHGTVLPWLAALALTASAGFFLGSTSLGATPEPGSAEPEIPRWLEVTGFLALAAAALFVRVYRISDIPAGIYVDETNGGLDALYVLEGRDDSPFGTGWYGTPNGYLYCMAAVFKVFGATWAGLKFASLLPAFLTVLAIYPLGRLMFGPVGGLSAMAFLAFNRWHMSMSRWGWNEVVPPLFQILATFFLLRGLRDRRSSDFVLGGLISGLMMYTYLSSRLALATLGLFALYFLLVDKGGLLAAWRRHWRGLALFLLSWTIATAPIAVTHITDPFSFANRVQEISIFRDTAAAGNLDLLWRNVADHLKFFHQIGDHQGKHNLPDEPHTDPLVGLLLLMGLGLALLRLRDPRRGLLWLWLLLGMAGGVFSSNHESPQSYRTLTAVPAVVLLAGDVLARIARVSGWLSAAAASAGATRRRGAIAGGTVVLAAWAFTAVWETGVYFGPQANSPVVRSGFNPSENSVAHDVLQAMKRGERVLVSPRFYAYSPLRFLVYGVFKRDTGRNTLDDPPYGRVRPEQDLPVPDPGCDTLLLIDIYYEPMLGYLRHFYPDARVEVAHGPDGGEIYLRVHLRRADLTATTGVIARVALRDGQSEEKAVPEPSATIVPPDAVGVEWTGSLWAETAGNYDFVLSRGLTLTLDGEPWHNARFLASGIHPFALVLGDPGELPTMRFEWVTPAGVRKPVPARLLFRIQPPAEGLTALYYANAEWRGDPLFARLTPMLLLVWLQPDPIPGVSTFSARFVGSLRVTTEGVYRFRLDADDGGRLYLDGKLIGECRINQLDTFPATVRLAAGDHPIQVDYYQLDGGNALGLFWQPPGKPEELVPPVALIPATRQIVR